MRVVIVCTESTPEAREFLDGAPNGLLPLVDRPLVQHVVEYLVANGFKQLDLIVSGDTQSSADASRSARKNRMSVASPAMAIDSSGTASAWVAARPK